MPLRVGFDATSAVRQGAGIGRYTRELLAALTARADNNLYRLYYCRGGRNGHLPPLDTRFRVRALPVSDRIMNAVWQRARLPLPIQMAIGRVDVFHSPDFTAPPALGVPVLITIHDLAFIRKPECAFPTLRSYLQRTVPRAAQRASHLIAVSEATRRDLIELFDLPPDRVTTVYEGVGDGFRVPLDRNIAREQVKDLGVREPYILSVGTLEPRKNYTRLLEAYALLRRRGVEHRLVIAGNKGWLYAPMFERLRSLKLEEHVTFLRPDDAGLRALYRAADLFVYPSLYEGFGIPPLEALASGLPVACSNAGSLPEVVGDAALTFEPEDVDGMADSIERLLGEPDVAARMTERGLRRAATFTWSRAAAETTSLYNTVASRG